MRRFANNISKFISLNFIFMAEKLSVDTRYKEWVVELKSKIGAAQIKAAMTVNRQLLELYWELGGIFMKSNRRRIGGDGLIGA